MVTARSHFGIRWARVVASPLRPLCLVALLLGFVSLHAVSAEAVSGHLTGCASAPAASAPHGAYGETAEGRASASAETGEPGAGERHHDDESAHSTHECVLAQPEQGPDVAAPCPALPAGAVSGATWRMPSSHPAAGFTPPDPQRTTVLRI